MELAATAASVANPVKSVNFFENCWYCLYHLDTTVTLGCMHPDFEQAARLLLEIAGPANEHIEMSRNGPAKYYTMYRALTFEDCLKHLQGKKTRGATLRHPDHRTRALAFDADVSRVYPGWWWITGAAQHLADVGYRVLLEPSPAGRGGHLWILFDNLVDACAARCHVCQIAPVLTDVGEYWPGPEWATTWNKVRLPGGKYVSPEISTWCKLYDTDGQLLSHDGLSAARVLLDAQTSALIVPPLPADYQEPPMPAPDRVDRRIDQEDRAHPHSTPAQQSAAAPRLPGAPDAQQQRKYSQVNQFLWFLYTPAHLADWYNRWHTVDDLLDFDSTGMANADALGRPERTPSVGSTRDRQHWADFGAAARQWDGRPDGGDALELFVRTSTEPKAEILRQLGQEMIAEARTELERTARSGDLPASWVQEIMSEAGWNHYWQVRNRDPNHE